MMKKTFQMMFALLAAVLVLASCTKDKSVATRLIPENAVIVGRFDVKQTIDKSGLNPNSRLFKKLKSNLSDADMSEEMREKLIDIVLNPNSSGIDFDQPVFFYFTGQNDNMAGLVGTVTNKGDLIELLNQIAEENNDDEVEEEDGIYRAGDTMVFSDDWFFVGDINDDIIETLKDMASTGEGSMAEDEGMQKLCEKTGVLSFLVSGKGLGQIDDRDMRKALQQLPEGLDINDVAAVADLQLNDGEALMESQILAFSTEWQEYIEESESAVNDITDELVEYVSNDGLAVFLNLDTNKLWEKIEQLLEANGMNDAETMNVAQKVFQSMEGSLALDVNGFTGERPNLAVFAKSRDSFIVEALSGMMEGEDLTSTGTNSFRFVEYDYDWDAYFNGGSELNRIPSAYLDFGSERNITYLYYNQQSQEFGSARNGFPARELKGKGCYARFNFDFFKNIDEDAIGEETSMIMKEVAKLFNYAEAYYEGEGKSVLRIATNDEDKTPLAIILDYIASMI